MHSPPNSPKPTQKQQKSLKDNQNNCNTYLDLLVLEWHESESSLDIIKNPEVVTGLGDGDDVHEPDGILDVPPDDSVNLNLVVRVVEDDLSLSPSQGVLQLPGEDQGQWNALSELVWALSWPGGVDSAQLVEHPSLWSSDSLHMLLRSSCLG